MTLLLFQVGLAPCVTVSKITVINSPSPWSLDREARVRCIPKSLLLVDWVLSFLVLWKVKKTKNHIYMCSFTTTTPPPPPHPHLQTGLMKATYRSFRNTNQILSCLPRTLQRHPRSSGWRPGLRRCCLLTWDAPANPLHHAPYLASQLHHCLGNCP